MSGGFSYNREAVRVKVKVSTTKKMCNFDSFQDFVFSLLEM